MFPQYAFNSSLPEPHLRPLGRVGDLVNQRIPLRAAQWVLRGYSHLGLLISAFLFYYCV
jgi:hypothetical protein